MGRSVMIFNIYYEQRWYLIFTVNSDDIYYLRWAVMAFNIYREQWQYLISAEGSGDI